MANEPESKAAKFTAWMRQVDNYIEGVCGLGHSDLADINWYDKFNDEVDPTTAARDFLTEEGFPVEALS